jgi:hypothetical protein
MSIAYAIPIKGHAQARATRQASKEGHCDFDSQFWNFGIGSPVKEVRLHQQSRPPNHRLQLQSAVKGKFWLVVFVGKKKPLVEWLCCPLQGNPIQLARKREQHKDILTPQLSLSSIKSGSVCLATVHAHIDLYVVFQVSSFRRLCPPLGFPIVQFSRSYIRKSETSPPPKKKVTKSSPIFNFSPSPLTPSPLQRQTSLTSMCMHPWAWFKVGNPLHFLASLVGFFFL